ncbi:branched-chain amino acid ABC transporter permease [Rhizobium sp. Root708]|uniref:ABC transporter permease n=1 Tax=Rhizobium sp. Root708 TaxID=1736592 RepID=UPI000701A064|nr:ABC transporter permease [Rhizobium sp. Root708]KRB49081.1 branched-chain amino acid ABC transporter permease [Rhizobium sp. Root708]
MDGFSLNLFFSYLFLGLMNGGFYALLSLGLAVIFGMLHIVNFLHGVQYMLGAFATVLLLQHLGLGYWWALGIAPVLVGFSGYVVERFLLSRVAGLNALYGMLLCIGLSMMIQGLFQAFFGLVALPYSPPPELRGGLRLPFMVAPYYRLWVLGFAVFICGATWFCIQKTKLGAYLRASTENPEIVRTFGIKVPLLVTLTYSVSVALAGLAGVLAAPIYQPQAFMGNDLIVVVFAVVVIGGMGSISGSIITGFIVGLLEGVVAYFYHEASSLAIFVLMVLILIVRPAGLFGWTVNSPKNAAENDEIFDVTPSGVKATGLMLAVGLLAAFFLIYKFTVLQALCFAIYALSVGFLVSCVGLLSFGHAMFLGAGSYTVAYLSSAWQVPTELAVIAGVMMAGALSYLVGLVALRRQGIYFAMITMGIAQMIYFLILRAPFSHGEDGIQNVPLSNFLGVFPLSDPTVLYVIVSAVFLVTVFAIGRVVNSPFGEVLKAVRDNEPRALSLGFKANRYKLTAFVISGALAGLAGSLKAVVTQSANLTDVHWSMSGQALLMVLIGGMGTLYGPILGAFIVFGLIYYFAFLGEWVLVAQGAVFAACVLLFRRGVVGEIITWLRRSSVAAKRSDTIDARLASDVGRKLS